MNSHCHAELMAEYAKDALETERPWSRWESQDEEGWKELHGHPQWAEHLEYRRKQKTVLINGIECIDDFVKEHPTSGVKYYIEDLCSNKNHFIVFWNHVNNVKHPLYETNALIYYKRGIMHTTPEGAIQACKARLGITDE